MKEKESRKKERGREKGGRELIPVKGKGHSPVSQMLTVYGQYTFHEFTT